MTRGRLRVGGAAAIVAVLVALLASCGADEGADRAEAARAYAARVADVTESTRGELAGTSRDADYREAVAAAATTRAYAAAIRGAADDLARASAPSAVAEEHRELIALYRTTADRLDGLAARFDGATGRGVLATLAQELSGEVQAYSTQEAQLRAAIDSGLASAAPTTPSR